MADLEEDLLSALLARPIGPAQPTHRPTPEEGFTKEIEVSGDLLTATLRGEPADVDEDAATQFLITKGLNPADWEPIGFRSSDWQSPNGEWLESRRFSFRRCATEATPTAIPLDDLFAAIDTYQPATVVPTGDYGFLVLLGDMQFGKGDGDGPAGTLAYTLGCLNRAADTLLRWRLMGYEVGHVHIAWLGDHIEGFVSQGGANAWRTRLTLTEQIRLTRRVMLHALVTFAPLAEKVTIAAVPGNHGETVRFAGKGLTRFDDSHDTESLVSVADAAALAPEKFSHVQFLVPDNDELVVITEVAGTIIAHAHGHQWSNGKHIEWWKGQAFKHGSLMHDAHLLVAGHLHHEFVDTWDHRLFLQVPAMESESTYFRHRQGCGGARGLIAALTKDGHTDLREVIR